MPINNAFQGKSSSKRETSSSPKTSQSDKPKEGKSRIKHVDPADTTFARFDGNPPKEN